MSEFKPQEVYNFLNTMIGTGRCPYAEISIISIKPYREVANCTSAFNRGHSCCMRDCHLIELFGLTPTIQWIKS
jgi:hypothetical protein